jgi:hypothetical protein
VRNPLLRRVWKSLFDVFPVFVPSDDRCTILWSKVWHWYPATDQMNHTQIGRMFANFAMTYNDDLPIFEWPSIFFAIFGAANCNKWQRRPNWESFVRVPQILNKWIRIISATSCQSPQTQNYPQTDSTMYDVCWSPRYVWEAFGRFHSSLVLRTCWACGSRVWFPNKDSQSIASKVLPNLGIPKHIAWKNMTWNARSASTATGATLFSQRRATVAGCGDQQTARSATAGFGFSHASGAPHSRRIIVAIKSHPPESIYLCRYTYIYNHLHVLSHSRLSTLG